MKMVTPVGFNALAVEALRELRAEKDAAIQDLNQKLEEKEVEIEKLKRKTSRMDELERRLLAMEKQLNQQTAMISGGDQ
jgi:hypothetical protein